MPRIKCLLGFASVYIHGQTYNFEKDENGDFTAQVFDPIAVECLKDLPAYQVINTAAAAQPAPVAPAAQPAARTKAEALAEAKALGVPVTARMSAEAIEAAIKKHSEDLATKMAADLMASGAPQIQPTATTEAPILGEQDGSGATDEPSASDQTAGDAPKGADGQVGGAAPVETLIIDNIDRSDDD